MVIAGKTGLGVEKNLKCNKPGSVGSYPAIVIPIMMQHYMMLRRNLLYTGITRGKKMVVLVGQKKAIGMAVKGRVERRRWSKLEEWLS
jgi:exodeoxyribonuclease V alpha subunit